MDCDRPRQYVLPSFPGFLSHTLDPTVFRSRQIKMLYIPFSELFAHSSGNRWNLIEIPDDNSDVKALCKHPCSNAMPLSMRERQRKQRHRETQTVLCRDREIERWRVTETPERQTEGKKEKQREKETERARR